MGDRASIELVYPHGNKDRSGEDSVFIYVHWHATETPKILAEALKRHARWNDEDYLAGIIMREFVRVVGLDTSESMGVSPNYADGVKWRVHLGNNTVEAPDLESKYDDPRTLEPISFEDFLASVAAGKDYGYGM